MDTAQTYGVAELAGLVSAAIERSFGGDIWVQGEIRDLNRSNAGHVYFSLADPDEANGSALLPVTLFAQYRDVVNRVLLRSGGAVRMTDGIHVRIRGRLSLYQQRSTVQLGMRMIDPAFTLGRLAADRSALIASLTKEGLLDRNGSLPFPLVPLRVGLITSVGSAAHADFLSELEASGFGFSVAVSHATVQGVDAPQSIARAMRRLAGRALDVVAVTRGGGAATDLAVFDGEAVARLIATAPHPVVVGIGHETDQTVSDLTAARSMKTPTACAAGLVGMVRAYVLRMDRHEADIHRVRESALLRSTYRLDAAVSRLAGGVQHHIERTTRDLAAARRAMTDAASIPQRHHATLVATADRIRQRSVLLLDGSSSSIDRIASDVAVGSNRTIERAMRHIGAQRALVNAHAPDRMLARGWTLTRAADGSLVRDHTQVVSGDHLETMTAGGTITSVVSETKPDSKKERP